MAKRLTDIEIAARVRKSPIDFIVKSLSDQRILHAALTALPYLSALSEGEAP